MLAGQLLIAGGTSGTQASRDVYRFDPRSGAVRELARLPYPVTHAAGATLRGALLVIGGRGSEAGTQYSSILAVTPAAAITVIGRLPLGREPPREAVLHDIQSSDSAVEVLSATAGGGHDRAHVRGPSVTADATLGAATRVCWRVRGSQRPM